ncbi:MAG: sulfite exporter TauE/SafE family protein [Candidatus Omnitrophica bacterium]|nr:sulfite exporter TauE/SafE family protein [Candidatus Omnitrophota bacterium]
MDPMLLWWLVPSFFVVSLLYASIGHGGASGYLALLSFSPAALAPDQMATTALTLNLIVAGMGWLAFARAGHFVGRLAWPFLAASVPAAFVGGLMPVSVRLYQVLLAIALGVAAIRLAVTLRGRDEDRAVKPNLALALPVGGGIGWLSGVVGVGGGVFLGPLLLLLRWATPKQTAAASAAFILVNSAAGLGGRAVRSGLEYGSFAPLLAAALIGGLFGAHLGANHFSGRTIKRALAVVLLVAAAKLLITQGT